MKRLFLAALCLALAAGGAFAQDMHRGVLGDDSCTSCHVADGPPEIDRSNCLSCHEAIDTELSGQHGFHYNEVIVAGKNCGECHLEHEAPGKRLALWSDEPSMRRFDHSPTGFPLTGTHAKLDCRQCHNSTLAMQGVSAREDQTKTFLGLSASCTGCHEGPHGRDMDCAQCHQPTSFNQLLAEPLFDHAAETGFALVGNHEAASCDDCHQDLRFSRIGVQCVDCHRDINHRGELGFDCAKCHEPHDWTLSTARLVEHTQTRFPLMGRHAVMDCEACHTNVQHDEYTGLPTDCIGCHSGDYLGTASPNHSALGFGTDCQECHSVNDMFWSEARFEHPVSFAATPGHIGVDCASCHRPGQVTPALDDCLACHRANNPPHIAGGFPTDCSECHLPTTFAGVTSYSHNASGFPGGVGQHAAADCNACHTSNTYAGLPADCFICHNAEYYNAASPNHRDLGFPTTCEDCHQPTDWHDTLGLRGQRWEVTR